MAVQGDGKAVVTGPSCRSGFGYDFVVARYNTDGSLGTTFDGDGKVITSFDRWDSAYSAREMDADRSR